MSVIGTTIITILAILVLAVLIPIISEILFQLSQLIPARYRRDRHDNDTDMD